MRTILVIDDNKMNLIVAKNTLSTRFDVMAVVSGQLALKYLENHKPDIILLDILMPQMDGIETFKRIRKSKNGAHIPIIFLTSEDESEVEAQCLALGADDFITKPFVPEVMKNRILRVLELYDFRNGLEEQLHMKTKQIEKLTLNSITVIANTIDAKDQYTAGHSMRVARISEMIAKNMGWNIDEIQNLHYVALLHDIGKIGIPDSILKKSDKLTEDEYAQIKLHPVIGGEILKDIHTIPHVEEGALYHHERYDGRGYPKGLKGEQIPITARIIGIADSYDAMSSDRVYRAHLSTARIIEEFEKGLGKQFDPEIGRMFIDMLKSGERFKIEADEEIDEEDITDESSRLLSKVISEFTIEVKNNAQMDSLTGLFNRNYVQENVSAHINSGGYGSLLMIDMDNFKSVNDTYGHIMGDEALKVFATTIKKYIRDTDIAGRFGGDEFCIFLSNQIDKNAIEKFSMRIINELNTRMDKLLPKNMTSVSIGITTCPDDGTDFNHLYKNADRALYHIKENGKNNFHFYNGKVRKKNTASAKADLTQLQEMLWGEENKKEGAMSVEYGDFGKIYTFASRYVERAKNGVQMALFTISSKDDGYIDTGITEEAMTELEASIITTLRSADVTTRYSSVQYLVILINTDTKNGIGVAQRIVNEYEKKSISSSVKVSFDVQDIRAVGEKMLNSDNEQSIKKDI